MSLAHTKHHLSDIFGEMLSTFFVNIGLTQRAKPSSDFQLLDKVVIVTGGNRGIGKCIATDLAARGAQVIIACRDVETGEVTASEIRSKIQGAKISVKKLDLASFNSVKQFASQINSSDTKVDILVNNAGLSSTNRIETEDGMELMMQVNCFSPILLSYLLMDKLSQSKGRIVNVSSIAHHQLASLDMNDLNWKNKSSFPYFDVYGHSKLALMLLTRFLSRKLATKNITVYAADPGITLTDFQSGMSKFERAILRSFVGRLITRPVNEAGNSIVSAVIDESNSYKPGEQYFMEDVKFKNPSPFARNDEAAQELWAIFQRMTKVNAL